MKVQSVTKAKVYPCRWFHQGHEPTCVPWAIANATLALGLEPNPILIRDLLNLARDTTNRDKGGLSFKKVKEVIDQKYPQIGINIVELSREGRLEPTEDLELHLLASKMSSNTIKEEVLRAVEEKNKKIIEKNRSIIKQIIDEEAKILASVFLNGHQDRHAICIVDYKVTENEKMNVLIIDSNRGVLWMSLEQLSKCIVPFNTYKILRT